MQIRYNTCAMILATDLKAGRTFLMDHTPYKVLKYSHHKVARGGGTVKVSLKDLKSGSALEKTFQSTAKFEEITTIKKPLQFLYVDSENAFLMNPETYEQVEIPLEILGDDIVYIKEGEDTNVLFWDEMPLSIELPPKVTLTVSETVPGVKGNSATNIYKPATMENGLSVRVPLFIKAGDKIRVDTRSGEYVERVTQS